MAVDALRCRVCESGVSAVASGICAALLRAARAGLRLGSRSPARSTARADRGRPALALALRGAAADAAPPDACGRRPGLDAARAGAAARARARRRRAAPEARPREPDALVQGPRRRRRRRQGGGARRRHARLRVDRQPRQCGRRARRRERHALGRPLPGDRRAREAARDGGLRRRDVRRARHATTTARASSSSSRASSTGRFVNVNLRAYYAEGSKTLAFEIVEQLGWETARRRRLARRVRLALHEALAGIRAVRAARPRRGRAARASTAARPKAARRSRTRSPRAGASPRCGRRRSPTRSRSARPPTATSRSRPRVRRAARSTRCRRTTSAPNMSLLAGTCGVFGETAAGVTIGALRAAAAAGEIGEGDRVVALITGTGLKTPQARRGARGRSSDIDARRRRAARRSAALARDQRDASGRQRRLERSAARHAARLPLATCREDREPLRTGRPTSSGLLATRRGS